MNSTRYTGDTVLIADYEEKLQQLLDVVVIKSENIYFFLHKKTSKCIAACKKAGTGT